MFLHLSVILFTGAGVCHTPRADTPPAECMLGYDQQAGGTHPSGMQSCFSLMFSLWQPFIINFTSCSSWISMLSLHYSSTTLPSAIFKSGVDSTIAWTIHEEFITATSLFLLIPLKPSTIRNSDEKIIW